MEDFGKLIYRLKTGSHLYGLSRPESDVDYMGIFIPRSDYLLGLKEVNEVDRSTKSSSAQHRNTSDDVDDKAYALPKFLHLVLQNNPNIVEVLFATDNVVEILEPEMRDLLDNKEKLLSQRVFHTFTGYAFSQRKKLTVKSERFNSLVVGVKYLEDTYTTEELSDSQVALDDDESDRLNEHLKYYKGQKHNCESFHSGMSLKMIYEKLVTERDNYGWRVKTDTFEELGYDVKFGYHLIRILAEGHQLLKTGELMYPITGTAREDILRVREGKVELEELLEMYDRYDALCKMALETTVLPKKPDYKWADKWLIRTLKKFIMEEDL